MKKLIEITVCKKCPYYVYFPAEFFEGDCGHNGVPDARDSRLRNADTIPDWCPL